MNYQLPASLTKKTVLACLNSIKSQKQSSAALVIDASSVKEVDSAGIALLLELKNMPGIQLSLLSPAILGLANLYRLNLK